MQGIDAERLYGRVNVTSDGCWEFNGCRERHGYGRIWYKYITMMAHRVSWMIANGPIPNELFVLHKCDNPPCINPKHLFLGTAGDNTQDMMSKGRRPIVRTPTLSNEQARFIKISLNVGSMNRRQLKEKFNISFGAIDAIKHRRNWKELLVPLYNLKCDGDQYRITKFDSELNPESSYLLTETECECPAGSRPICRHRTMLPKMLAVGAEDSGMFYDYDTAQFFQSTLDPDCGEAEDRSDPVEISPPEDTPSIEQTFDQLALDLNRFNGITVLGLDDLGAVHNAIADAVGEPRAEQCEGITDNRPNPIHSAVTGKLTRRL